jgi:hypothetical protein
MQAHVLGRDVMPDWLYLSLFAILVTAGAIATGRIDAQRTTYICVLVFVLSELLASVAKTGDSLRMYPTLAFADRYFVAVKIFAWWCIAVVISAAWRRDIRVVRVVMVVLLGINALFIRDALQRRPLEDMNWYPYARMIDDGDAVVVPINPRYWKINIPQRPGPPSR